MAAGVAGTTSLPWKESLYFTMMPDPSATWITVPCECQSQAGALYGRSMSNTPTCIEEGMIEGAGCPTALQKVVIIAAALTRLRGGPGMRPARASLDQGLATGTALDSAYRFQPKYVALTTQKPTISMTARESDIFGDQVVIRARLQTVGERMYRIGYWIRCLFCLFINDFRRLSRSSIGVAGTRRKSVHY